MNRSPPSSWWWRNLSVNQYQKWRLLVDIVTQVAWYQWCAMISGSGFYAYLIWNLEKVNLMLWKCLKVDDANSNLKNNCVGNKFDTNWWPEDASTFWYVQNWRGYESLDFWICQDICSKSDRMRNSLRTQLSVDKWKLIRCIDYE